MYNFHWDARDTSGSGFHGTLTGSPALTSNQLTEANSAYLFDGTAKYISAINNPALDVQLLTISAFVSFTTLSQNWFIFEKGLVNTQYALFSEWTNIIFRTKPAWAYHSTTVAKSACWIVSTGTFYHIVATYDGAYKRIYVNWVKIVEDAWVGTISTNTWGQWIWAYGWGGAYRLNWAITSVRVYWRVLSDAEVVRLYKVSIWVISIESNGELIAHSFDSIWFDTTWLVAMYNMNGSANDGSGNGNHWTVSWATLTSDQFWNANSAYSCDGVANYIAESKILLNDVPWYTVFFWINPTSKLTRSRPITSANLITWYYWNAWGSWTNYQWFVWNWAWYSTWANAPSFFTFWQWQFVAITYDKATWRLYKNWLQVSSQAFIRATITQTVLSSFMWNFWVDSCQWSIWRAWIIWRVLSDAEILKLYNASKWQPSMEKWKYISCELDWIHADTSWLQALYNMNGNIEDSTVNWYNWTVNWAVLATDKFWNTNSAYSFDGINDYITMWDVLDVWLWDFSYVVRFKTSSVWALTWLMWKTKAGAWWWRYWLLFESWLLTSLCSLWWTVRNVAISQTPYVDWNWHIAIVTMNRVWNHVLWVDWINKWSVSISADVAVDSQSTYPFWIWAYQNSTWTAFTQWWLNWMLWPIQIFNRVLSDAEVQYLSKAFLWDMSMIKWKTVINKFISL